MEEEKKEEVKVEEKKGRSTKSKIITILLGICLFCVFVILGYILIVGDRNEEPAPPKKEEQKQEEQKEDDNEDPTTVKENLPSNAVIEVTYSTQDGKDYIKVISKDDQATYNEAKRIYEKVEKLHNEDNDSEINTYENHLKDLVSTNKQIKKYIWHNNTLFEVFAIDEGNTYTLYVADRVNSYAQGQGSFYFLANRKENFLVPSLNLKDRGDYYTNYQVFNGGLAYYETNAGNFFAIYGWNVSMCDVGDLYTTSWKSLGHFYSDKFEVDDKGVYVYTDFIDNYTENDVKCLNEKTKIKVDANGNKIG